MIPYSGGLAGDCGFAYPLLVYWNKSLSVPRFPLSFSLFENHTSRSPSRLLLSSSRPFRALHPLSYTFRRSFFDSFLSTKRTRREPGFNSPRSLPPRPSLALCLPISISPLLSIALSAAQTLGHVHKAHRSPAFITRYEIAPPASSRFTHTHSPRIRSPDATPSRYILANFANVGSRRITHLQQYRLFLHPHAVRE